MLAHRLTAVLSHIERSKMIDNLSLVSQHEQFRRHFVHVVESRRLLLPAAQHSWLVSCYDSLEAFAHRFPDRHDCLKQLEEWESKGTETEELLEAEISRLRAEGLRYQDIESLQYEFPSPEEEDE